MAGHGGPKAASQLVLLLFFWLCRVAQTKHNSSLLELDLADLQYSNLQGQGPHSGTPRGLRYRGVGWAGGFLLDLLVDAEDRYNPFDTSQNVNAGVGNEMGRINIKVGTHLELTFRLVRTGTSTPQEVEEFHMTFVLADKRLELQVFDFADYCISAGTGLVHDFSKSMGSLSLWPSRPTLLESVVLGDPGLAQDVMDRAVTFTFRRTAHFAAFAYATGVLEEAGLNLLFTGAAYIPAWNCYQWKGKGKGRPRPAASSVLDCDPHHGPLRFRAVTAGRSCAHVGMETITDRATCKAAAEALHLSTSGPSCSHEAPGGCSVEMGRSGVSLFFSQANTSKTGGSVTPSHQSQQKSASHTSRRPLCKTQVWDDSKASWCCKHKDVGCPLKRDADSECSGKEDDEAERMNITTLPASSVNVSDCSPLVHHAVVSYQLRRRCCVSHNIGCLDNSQPVVDGSSNAGNRISGSRSSSSSSSSSSSTTTTAFPVTTTFTFPLCQGIPAGRRLTWSSEEQRWCCLHWGLGCTFSPDDRSVDAGSPTIIACEPGEDCNSVSTASLRPQRLFAGTLPALLGTDRAGLLAIVVLGAFASTALFLTSGRLWRNRAYSALPTEDCAQLP